MGEYFARRARSWFVVNTHPNKEPLAMLNLGRQGFTTYCPFVLKSIRHARKERKLKRPVFPSYVFVEDNDASRQWRAILSTFGVRSLIQMANEPARLDASFVEAMKAREVDGVIVQPARPYEVGQKIRVNGGPMDGLVAEIIELRDHDRLTVLMSLLQQPVKVHLNSEMVLPV